MLFLLRLAFWIMLICLLIPSSREENRRLMSSAERTVTDMRGFCQRNPDVCEDARVTMTSMLSRFKTGAEVLQTWLSEIDKPTDGERGSEAPAETPAPNSQSEIPKYPSGSAAPLKPAPKWQDSLNPADKQLPWRGPARL